MNTFISHHERLLLIGLLAASAVLHFIFISYPGSTVFDEAHFATYASNYARGKATFDIHPPLGKVLFALPLFFYGPEGQSGAYIDFSHGGPTISYQSQEYDAFPYIALRTLSAPFGILLVLTTYYLIRALTKNPSAALWSAALIAFENALLLHTRLILLDGMYLALGLLALYFFFRERQAPLWGGIVWGLALGVKLTAIVFLGPVLMGAFFFTDIVSRRNAAVFAATGLVMLALMMLFLTSVFVSPDKRLAFYESLHIVSDTEAPEREANAPPAPQSYLKALLVESAIVLGGYTTDKTSDPGTRNLWYEWPLMRGGLMYYTNENRTIGLVGNPTVWFLGTGALFVFLLTHGGGLTGRTKKIGWLLAASYGFSLLPFLTIVERNTYLYHYFPALIFSVMLAGLIIAHYLEAHPETAKRNALLLLGVLVLGFLSVARYTYGF